jgi:hypothetical protein
MVIHKSKNININDIKFSEPKAYSKGLGSSINFYLDKKPLYIQTPRMLSKYGVNIYRDEKSEIIKSITLVLQFNSMVDKPNRVDNFLKKIKKIDELVNIKATKNHKKWLHLHKSYVNKDSIEALQKKSLYYSNLQNMEIDYSKPPTFKIKLQYYNNEIQNVLLLNKDNEKINYTLEDLEKKLKGEVIIKCIINPSIYIVNQNFGITYNVKAIQIINKMKTEKKKETKNTINNYFNIIDGNKHSESSDNL